MHLHNAQDYFSDNDDDDDDDYGDVNDDFADETAWIWHAGESGNIVINSDADRVNKYDVWDYAEGQDSYRISTLVDLTQPPDEVSVSLWLVILSAGEGASENVISTRRPAVNLTFKEWAASTRIPASSLRYDSQANTRLDRIPISDIAHGQHLRSVN